MPHEQMPLRADPHEQTPHEQTPHEQTLREADAHEQMPARRRRHEQTPHEQNAARADGRTGRSSRKRLPQDLKQRVGDRTTARQEAARA